MQRLIVFIKFTCLQLAIDVLYEEMLVPTQLPVCLRYLVTYMQEKGNVNLMGTVENGFHF